MTNFFQPNFNQIATKFQPNFNQISTHFNIHIFFRDFHSIFIGFSSSFVLYFLYFSFCLDFAFFNMPRKKQLIDYSVGKIYGKIIEINCKLIVLLLCHLIAYLLSKLFFFVLSLFRVYVAYGNCVINVAYLNLWSLAKPNMSIATRESIETRIWIPL